MKRIYLILLLISILTGSKYNNVIAGNPWDIVLLDISSDLMAKDKNNRCEQSLIDSVIPGLIKSVGEEDSVMLFANGRVIIPIKDYVSSDKEKIEFYRNCIGDGTFIYNAIASNFNQGIDRMLVITNGVDNGSGVSPKTLTKILRGKGVIVDAVITRIDADSVMHPQDSIYRLKPSYNDGFMQMVKNNGGCILMVDEKSNDVSLRLNQFIKEVDRRAAKHSNTKKVDLDMIVTDRIIGDRLRHYKIDIVEVDTCSILKYNDKVFHGLNEIRELAKHDPTIRVDKKPYLKFDSSDEAYDDRCFENYIFGNSLSDVDNKMILLRKPVANNDFCKLSDNIDISLLPMIYYKGEGDEMLICGFELIY